MKNLVLFLLAIFTIISVNSCNRDEESNNSKRNNLIVGVWNNPEEEVCSLTFTKEGRFYSKAADRELVKEEDNGTYQFDGKKLKTKYICHYYNNKPIYMEVSYICKVDINKLYLYDEEDVEDISIYTRQ